MADVNSADQLRTVKCVPCEGGIPKMSAEEARQQLGALPGWELAADPDRIRREWKVRNFMEGMRFFNAIAELAEDEGHHPDLHIRGYRNVTVEIWTHAVGGLSQNDFILAAKIDALSVDAVN